MNEMIAMTIPRSIFINSSRKAQQKAVLGNGENYGVRVSAEWLKI
jgi:hypothetical protein